MQNNPDKTLSFSDRNNVSTSVAQIISEDLATFLISHYVLVARNSSLSSIKMHFKSMPDLAPAVEQVMLDLENAEFIRIEGDKVEVVDRIFDLSGDAKNMLRFVPRLFALSAERILVNHTEPQVRKKHEALRYSVLPNDPQIAAEAKAMQLEFSSKLYKLLDKAKNVTAEGIQLVGVFQAELVSEDFV